MFALPYGQRKARRLRLSWLNTIAAVSAPIPAILAIVDFLQFLGVLGDGRIALSWLTLVVLNAVVLVLTHVVQRPTIRRGGVVRVPAVDDRVASEWAGLAGDQVRIIRPTA